MDYYNVCGRNVIRQEEREMWNETQFIMSGGNMYGIVLVKKEVTTGMEERKHKEDKFMRYFEFDPVRVLPI